jgi:hypothetical protein
MKVKAWEVMNNDMVEVDTPVLKGVKEVSYTPCDFRTGNAESHEFVTFTFYDGTILTVPSNNYMEVLNF